MLTLYTIELEGTYRKLSYQLQDFSMNLNIIITLLSQRYFYYQNFICRSIRILEKALNILKIIL